MSAMSPSNREKNSANFRPDVGGSSRKAEFSDSLELVGVGERAINFRSARLNDHFLVNAFAVSGYTVIVRRRSMVARLHWSRQGKYRSC